MYVFPKVVARGKPSHIKNLHSTWTAVIKQAGIKHARIHDLRHSFVSIGVDKGIDIPSLGGAVGHANPAVTAQVYAHLGRDRVRSTVVDVSSTINAALNGS